MKEHKRTECPINEDRSGTRVYTCVCHAGLATGVASFPWCSNQSFWAQTTQRPAQQQRPVRPVRLLRLLRLSSVVSNLSLMRFANDYIPTRLLTDAYTELLELRGAGGPRTPRFWLTIFEPGWQIMPIILLTARQIFSHTYDPAMP